MGYNKFRVEEALQFQSWFLSLRDQAVRARIQVRIERLIHGNPGSHRNLRYGVSELKIDLGPGYRVYYMVRGGYLLLLLAGGDKATQVRDIENTIQLATAYGE